MLLGMFLFARVILLIMACLGAIGAAISVSFDPHYKIRHKIINAVFCALILIVLIPVTVYHWELCDYWISVGRFN